MLALLACGRDEAKSKGLYEYSGDMRVEVRRDQKVAFNPRFERDVRLCRRTPPLAGEVLLTLVRRRFADRRTFLERRRPELINRNLSDRFTFSGPVLNQLALTNLRRCAPMGGHVSDRMPRSLAPVVDTPGVVKRNYGAVAQNLETKIPLMPTRIAELTPERIILINTDIPRGLSRVGGRGHARQCRVHSVPVDRAAEDFHGGVPAGTRGRMTPSS